MTKIATLAMIVLFIGVVIMSQPPKCTMARPCEPNEEVECEMYRLVDQYCEETAGLWTNTSTVHSIMETDEMIGEYYTEHKYNIGDSCLLTCVRQMFICDSMACIENNADGKHDYDFYLLIREWAK